MSRKIVIDPLTRLEGHGKIVIVIDDVGNVIKSYLQLVEFRGFERFLIGRPIEEAPQITSRICGVCPMAHHMAATKALDDIYNIDPPIAAKKIRELVYNLFIIEDHSLHFYFLGGPDLIVGLQAPRSERNIIGVLNRIGREVGLKAIKTRAEIRNIITAIAGKVTHPVFGLPGGVSKPITKDIVDKLIDISDKALEFSLYTYRLFKDIVMSNNDRLNLMKSDIYSNRTYYMGFVDNKNNVNFYDGVLRIVDPDGKEYAKFDVHEYQDYLAEHVEPWTYAKFTYLKNIGWKGFIEGKESGILAVGPLARLNVSEGFSTPYAQEAYEEIHNVLGPKPIHNTIAYHWARIIEMIYAAERVRELSRDPDILDTNVRNIPTQSPKNSGIGGVEAPRGTLIHHYECDENGIIVKANLLVATQHNTARMSISINNVAKNIIQGNISDEILNTIEMVFRAYDPCIACATHSLRADSLSFIIYIYNQNGDIIKTIRI